MEELKMKTRILCIFLVLISYLFIVGCEVDGDETTGETPHDNDNDNGNDGDSETPVFTLSSLASDDGFDPGSSIPAEFKATNGTQCTGDNNFPKLSWSNPPSGTNSFVLIVDDPDGGDWVHLNLYNIPSTTSSIPRIEDASSSVPKYGLDISTISGGFVGANGWGSSVLGWSGPCPPSGTTHTYYFKLYAMSVSSISAIGNIKRSDFETANSASILDSTEISATSSF